FTEELEKNTEFSEVLETLKLTTQSIEGYLPYIEFINNKNLKECHKTKISKLIFAQSESKEDIYQQNALKSITLSRIFTDKELKDELLTKLRAISYDANTEQFSISEAEKIEKFWKNANFEYSEEEPKKFNNLKILIDKISISLKVCSDLKNKVKNEENKEIIANLHLKIKQINQILITLDEIQPILQRVKHLYRLKELQRLMINENRKISREIKFFFEDQMQKSSNVTKFCFVQPGFDKRLTECLENSKFIYRKIEKSIEIYKKSFPRLNLINDQSMIELLIETSKYFNQEEKNKQMIYDVIMNWVSRCFSKIFCIRLDEVEDSDDSEFEIKSISCKYYELQLNSPLKFKLTDGVDQILAKLEIQIQLVLSHQIESIQNIDFICFIEEIIKSELYRKLALQVCVHHYISSFYNLIFAIANEDENKIQIVGVTDLLKEHVELFSQMLRNREDPSHIILYNVLIIARYWLDQINNILEYSIDEEISKKYRVNQLLKFIPNIKTLKNNETWIEYNGFRIKMANNYIGFEELLSLDVDSGAEFRWGGNDEKIFFSNSQEVSLNLKSFTKLMGILSGTEIFRFHISLVYESNMIRILMNFAENNQIFLNILGTEKMEMKIKNEILKNEVKRSFKPSQNSKGFIFYLNDCEKEPIFQMLRIRDKYNKSFKMIFKDSKYNEIMEILSNIPWTKKNQGITSIEILEKIFKCAIINQENDLNRYLEHFRGNLEIENKLDKDDKNNFSPKTNIWFTRNGTFYQRKLSIENNFKDCNNFTTIYGDAYDLEATFGHVERSQIRWNDGYLAKKIKINLENTTIIKLRTIKSIEKYLDLINFNYFIQNNGDVVRIDESHNIIFDFEELKNSEIEVYLKNCNEILCSSDIRLFVSQTLKSFEFNNKSIEDNVKKELLSFVDLFLETEVKEINIFKLIEDIVRMIKIEIQDFAPKRYENNIWLKDNIKMLVLTTIFNLNLLMSNFDKSLIEKIEKYAKLNNLSKYIELDSLKISNNFQNLMKVDYDVQSVVNINSNNLILDDIQSLSFIINKLIGGRVNVCVSFAEINVNIVESFIKSIEKETELKVLCSSNEDFEANIVDLILKNSTIRAEEKTLELNQSCKTLLLYLIPFSIYDWSRRSLSFLNSLLTNMELYIPDKGEIFKIKHLSFIILYSENSDSKINNSIQLENTLKFNFNKVSERSFSALIRNVFSLNQNISSSSLACRHEDEIINFMYQIYRENDSLGLNTVKKVLEHYFSLTDKTSQSSSSIQSFKESISIFIEIILKEKNSYKLFDNFSLCHKGRLTSPFLAFTLKSYYPEIKDFSKFDAEKSEIIENVVCKVLQEKNFCLWSRTECQKEFISLVMSCMKNRNTKYHLISGKMEKADIKKEEKIIRKFQLDSMENSIIIIFVKNKRSLILFKSLLLKIYHGIDNGEFETNYSKTNKISLCCLIDRKYLPELGSELLPSLVELKFIATNIENKCEISISNATSALSNHTVFGRALCSYFMQQNSDLYGEIYHERFEKLVQEIMCQIKPLALNKLNILEKIIKNIEIYDNERKTIENKLEQEISMIAQLKINLDSLMSEIKEKSNEIKASKFLESEDSKKQEFFGKQIRDYLKENNVDIEFICQTANEVIIESKDKQIDKDIMELSSYIFNE
ncbi:MAG: hypothetical protein MHPSP_000226, partial [Paramarteilia canceri]